LPVPLEGLGIHFAQSQNVAMSGAWSQNMLALVRGFFHGD